jgi:hypothetical protein
MLERALALVALLVFGAGASGCGSLTIATVGAPAINCVFDSDCTITVSDFVDEFGVPLASGDARLQSRSQPPGEAGTAGAGLFAHEYRVDLTPTGALTAFVCVRSLSLDFGPIERLDYDGDGDLDHLYVVTSGGLGTVAPSSASRSGGRVTFDFQPGVCPGNAPGNGETSFFFGLASADPAAPVEATVRFDDGSSTTVDARSPG